MLGVEPDIPLSSFDLGLECFKLTLGCSRIFVFPLLAVELHTLVPGIHTLVCYTLYLCFFAWLLKNPILIYNIVVTNNEERHHLHSMQSVCIGVLNAVGRR